MTEHLKASPNAFIHTDPGAPTFPFDTDRFQPGSPWVIPMPEGVHMAQEIQSAIDLARFTLK
jgi:hypothetical protein